MGRLSNLARLRRDWLTTHYCYKFTVVLTATR